MSLVGRKAAVVSLGMSCQTTLQIDDHSDLIARGVGDLDLRPSSLPFDNLVCHPRAATRLLDNDAFYPASKDELAVYRGAFWTAQQVYFRHECTLRKSRPIEYLRGKVDVARGYRDLFVQDTFVGADPKYRLPIRVINELAWHSLFARTMFISNMQSAEPHQPEFTIINFPSFQADPQRDGTRSPTFRTWLRSS